MIYIQSRNRKTFFYLKFQIFIFRAKAEFDSHIVVVKDWTGFLKGLDNSCIMLAPFCGESECEDRIKKDSAR
jgi:hypothetical protein